MAVVARRVVNIITNIFIAVAVVLVVVFCAPRLFGLQPYAVLSGSMEPEYPVGSLLYVHAADPATIEVGDAVTFTRGGTTVTHEACAIDFENQTIETQGIANRNSDGSVMRDAEPVPFSQVIGVPVVCIPFLGYVNVFCTTMPGILIIALVAAALVAAGGSKRRGRAAVRGARR